MIKLDIAHAEWITRLLPNGGGQLWFKGYLHGKTIDVLTAEALLLQRENVGSFLRALDGHFSLIIERREWSLAAVDKICSSSLFFLFNDPFWQVDTNAARLVKSANLIDLNVNSDAVLAVSMSGYTIGGATLYHSLQALTPGEAVLFEEGRDPQRFHYYRYSPWKVVDGSYEDYLFELGNVTLGVLQKMLDSVGDRQIVIPLSAGNDSRLIASGLKRLGAENVKCFTYGIKDNFEALISRRVAEKLGYEWRFIPLSRKSEAHFYRSHEFGRYWQDVETYRSIPYIQGLSATKYLKISGWINDDAVFVNGNTGDFISGGHIPNAIYDNPNFTNLPKENQFDILIEEAINKHFSLWEYLKTPENLDTIIKCLRDEIRFLGEEKISADTMHGIYEYLELLGRQSKYILANQRVYEFYGYEWRLPLWDQDYLRFWEKVPLSMKAGQRLYLDMLKQQNWGGVWNNSIPVNKMTIRPRWLIPVRVLAKMGFALFGKKGKLAWKQFDKRVLYYWRDVAMTVAFVPYWQILSDKRGARHMMAFLAEAYLGKFFRERGNA